MLFIIGYILLGLLSIILCWQLVGLILRFGKMYKSISYNQLLNDISQIIISKPTPLVLFINTEITKKIYMIDIIQYIVILLILLDFNITTIVLIYFVIIYVIPKHLNKIANIIRESEQKEVSEMENR